jgi:hypothetical protein
MKTTTPKEQTMTEKQRDDLYDLIYGDLLSGSPREDVISKHGEESVVAVETHPVFRAALKARERMGL